MRKNLLITLVLVWITAIALHAQNSNRTCGTMEYLDAQKAADPGLEARMVQLEKETQQWISNQQNLKSSAVITIPTVVHVVWNTSSQNISDARVIEQINVLNKDFSRTNTDAGNTPSVFQGVAANTQVQFCLAQRDPSGNATNGIVRRQTSVTSFSTNNNVKFTANGGSNAWPAGSYLNIWVCNLGSGLLGYGQFPGGNASTDGVVVLYSSVGGPNAPGTANPYHLGRTATHEVGHWLNLYHIWGDDGSSCSGADQVSDTPNQADEHYGCPSFPQVSCSNGPNGDMYMNYMDYTNDACMNMFTSGQGSRMQAVLAGSRSSLQSSLGCTPVGGCTDNFEPNNTKATAASITLSTDISGKITPSGDIDFFNITNTASMPNIRVTLTNLPANYDLKLVKGSVVASSNNSGTASETINYNTSVVGNYKVKVAGFSGANNASQCYTVRVTLSNTPFRTASENEIIFEKQEALTVYPNPVKDIMNVHFNSASDVNVDIRIIDMVGRPVLKMQKPASEGMNKFDLNLSERNKGIYFVEVTNGLDKQIRKIILNK